MTPLPTMSGDVPGTVLLRTDDPDDVHQELIETGVRRERWHATPGHRGRALRPGR